MTVFQLNGWTARIDWASTSERKSLGLFSSREKAQARIEDIKLDRNWHMDWSGFEISEVEVE